MSAEEFGQNNKVTGGSAVLRFFEARTAERVFGLPGSSSVPIFHAFPWSQLKFVPAVQENIALAMADGYARLAGPTGVLLYMLPGVATALSNLYNAARDETPLVLVASQQASYARWGQGSVGEADLTEIAAPFTRFAREATNGAQLIGLLEAAHRSALGPPGGPSLIVAPEDLLRQDLVLARFPLRKRERLAPVDLTPVAEKLTAALRPLIVVGGQLRRCGGSASIEALADEFEIPVMYEPFWNDRLGLSPGHRCNFSHLTEGSSLGNAADFVLAIGCRLFNEVHPRSTPWFPEGAFVAHVNADVEKLEQTFSVDWSSAADPGAVAQRLLEECRNRGITDAVRVARSQRLESAGQRRRGRQRSSPYADAAEALSGELEHAYLVDESVSASPSIVASLRGYHGERYISTTGGSLGWGIAASCGVALATGGPVTCVLGDGAFFFGVQALSHAVSLRLPITFVVLDNGGFGSTQWFEQQYAKNMQNESYRVTNFVGSDFRGVRASVIDVARGFGINAVDLKNGRELAHHLELDRGNGPSLVRLAVQGAEPTGKK
jgi:thiamine pyrophosphate-dependent acetolactate synthase large subunit-like protein